MRTTNDSLSNKRHQGHEEAFAAVFKETTMKADNTMQYFLYGFLLFGILISPIYETYQIAFTIEGLCLLLYFIVRLTMPGSQLLKYVISSLFCILAAQFIYQLHGLFEMHFFFFLIVNIMILYKDWRVFLPITILIVIHHSSFAYLQNSGYTNVFFSQLGTIDFLSLVFHYLLFIIHVLVCGWWSIKLRNQAYNEFLTVSTLQLQEVNNKTNLEFAEQVSKGNLEAQFELSENNELGKELLKMRGNLKNIAKEESERSWATDGNAKLTEILRINNSNLDQLAEEVLIAVVKYLRANQGAFYIVDDSVEGDHHIQMKACYAFNRKKFITKRIELGEGLVGQTVLEKEPIYLTEIPSGYVKITSGLGDSSPTNIFIAPFVVNEKVQGVIEICSFYKFARHEMEFIKKLSESIGSSIQTVKTNEMTRKLLQESQSMTEILKGQEEEMRQNLEEMESTQEEMRRLGSEMEGQIKAINATMATIEFDLKGYILTANDNFLKLMNYSLDDIKGKHHQMFVEELERNSHEYKEFWKKLGDGTFVTGEFKRITQSGKEIYIRGIYNPIQNSKGEVTKILKLAYDITDQKLLIQKVQAQLDKEEVRN